MKDKSKHGATSPANSSSAEDVALMSRIFDCALDIMGLVDDGGRILMVNQAVRTALNHDPAALVGTSLLTLIHPEDQALVVEEIERTLNGTSTRVSIDIRCRHADGSWRILEAVANPLTGEAPTRLVVTARDITLRKQDEALQQAQDAMEDAARNARTPLELFAAAHRIIGTLVPADNFFVALCESKTGWLSFPYWVDRRDPGPPAHPPGTGLSEYVIKTNRPLHVTPDTLPGFLAGSGAEVLGSLPVEWIGYPLRAPEGPLGLMVLQTYDPGVTLGPYALRVLETLAAPLALAANNLRQDEARQDSEQSYQALFSEMPTAFCIATLDDPADGRPAQARIRECNRAMEQLWRRTRLQLLDRTIAEVIAPESPPWLNQLAVINETGQPRLNVEWNLPARNQHLMVHLYRVGPDQLACLMEDVSARKQTEFAQRRHDALLEALAYTAGRFLHTPDWEGCIQDVLGALGRAADVSRVYLFENECTPQGSLVCSQRYEWVAAGVESHLQNPILQKLDLDQIGLSPWQAEMKQGHLVAGSIAALPARHQELFAAQEVRCLLLMPILVSGYFWGFIGCDECRREREWLASERDAFRAIAQTLGEAIQRRNAEEAMQLRGVALASAANGIVITDHNGHILYVNQAFQQLTGFSAGEVIGHTPAVLKSGQHDDAFYRQMWQHMKDGKVWRGELINRRKDGTLYQEEMTITPVRNATGKVTNYIAIKQDVSERRNLQQQLQQAQKMESIGRLAGGIAHDFNNLLQAITGFSSILLADLGEGDPRRGDVEEIDRAAQRAVALTRQLLAFSRKQKMEMVALDVNHVVQGTEKMLRRLIGENIALESKLGADLPPVLADSGQLEQVIVNLAVNARDAMPEGGRLILRTRKVNLPAQAVPDMGSAPPGDYLELSVEDNGTGMSPAVRERLFEPFFSTKGAGKGTGLGLAVVYGIVRQHAGFVDVATTPAVGTTMTVFLPVAGAEAVAAPRPSSAATINHHVRGRSERILLVEDEPGVRELAARVLREQHYQVESAATCAEARTLFAAATLPFDLLLSDVILPDGNGINLADELTTERPTLPVLLCSAYSDEQARSKTIQERGYRFLPKPYPMAALLREVRLLMDRITPS